MPKFLNPKIIIISLIVLPLFILAGPAVYFLNQKQLKIISPKAEESEQEKIISRQLKEIDELRQRINSQSLTEKEKKAQSKDLQVLSQQSGIKPLSQAEIQRQLEELDKLRLGSY